MERRQRLLSAQIPSSTTTVWICCVPGLNGETWGTKTRNLIGLRHTIPVAFEIVPYRGNPNWALPAATKKAALKVSSVGSGVTGWCLCLGSVGFVRCWRKYSWQSSYGIRRRRYSFLTHAQAESSSEKSFTRRSGTPRGIIFTISTLPVSGWWLR
jgi:hypothetical protein